MNDVLFYLYNYNPISNVTPIFESASNSMTITNLALSYTL